MKEETGNIWHYPPRGYLIVIPTNMGWRKDGWNVMGRGLAKQASMKFPKLPAIYGEMCQDMADTGPEIRFWADLVLFPVKPLNEEFPYRSWQSHALPELIEQSAIQLAEWTNEEEQVAVPLVGCGNGQLSETVVLPILNNYLNDDRFVLVRQGE